MFYKKILQFEKSKYSNNSTNIFLYIINTNKKINKSKKKKSN